MLREVFTIASKFVIAIILLIPFVIFLINHSTGRNIIIKPLSAPKELEDMGLGGGIIAKHVVDNIVYIQNRASTIKERHKLFPEWSLSEPTVPFTEVRVDVPLQHVKALFGTRDITVDGDISASEQKDAVIPAGTISVKCGKSEERKKYFVRLRITEFGSLAPTFLSFNTSLPCLHKEVAFNLLSVIDPVILASFIINTGQSATEIIRRCIVECDDSEDKAYSLNFQGVELLKTGDNYSALASFTYAVQLSGDTSLFYANRATAQHRLGDEKRALEDLRVALEIEPDNFRAWLVRGNIECSLKKYAEADGDFEKANSLQPGMVDIMRAWGGCLRLAGQHQRATDILARAQEVENAYLQQVGPMVLPAIVSPTMKGEMR